MTKLKWAFALFFMVFAIGFSNDARATPILGGSVVVAATGPVKATFVSQSAGYDSVLSLVAGDLATVLAPSFFHNHLTVPGTTIDLGNFAAGTELIFELNVFNTGDKFYTGPAHRNPDNVFHAVLDFTGGETTLSFEDLFGGGDRDYNDIVFSLTNVRISATPPIAAPEPAGLIIFGLGLVVLGLMSRKKLPIRRL